MAKEIKGINLRGLPNDNNLTFHLMTSQRAQADEAIMQHFEIFVTPYLAAVQKEDEVMHPSQGSLLTPGIEQGDKYRDATYDAFERIVEGYTRFPDEQTQADAKRLQKAMKTNKVNIAAQYDRETGQIINLVQDLQENYQPELERLHLTEMIARLKQENDEVYRLLKERDEQNAEKVLDAVRKARNATDYCYLSLKDVVNAYSRVGADIALDSFIDSTNETIDRLNLQVFKITQSKPEGTTPTPDPDDTDNTEGGEGGDNTDNTEGGENTGGDNTNPSVPGDSVGGDNNNGNDNNNQGGNNGGYPPGYDPDADDDPGV